MEVHIKASSAFILNKSWRNVIMSAKSINEQANDDTNASQEQTLPILADKLNHEQHISPRSLVGKDITIKGNVAAKEDMLINGHVEGTIALKNNRLEIGETGRVHADTLAKVVVVSGEIKGDVYASQQVIVTKSGRVYGSIFASDVTIEDGALLKGSIDMKELDMSKQYSVPDFEDDHPNKGNSFSSLFKRVREIAHLDPTTTNDMPNFDISSDKQSPLALDKKSSHDFSNMDISVIGESVMIKGNIISDEDVAIQGQIDGIIYFKNNRLIVGPHAQIHATILVKSVITHGEIKGDIFAGDQVIIRKPGHVFGDVHSPRISIESGAVLMGSVEMEQQNIENIFSNMPSNSATKEGSRTVEVETKESEEYDRFIEQADSRSSAVKEVYEHHETVDQNSRHHAKDIAWPIFYPRS